MSFHSPKKIVFVDGDGNCMFRSIVQAYHAENTHQTLTQHQEISEARKLRKLVAEYILRHPRAVEGELDYLQGSVRNINQFSREYAAHIGSWSLKKWGGPTELAIASHILKRKIILYDATGTRIHHISASINRTNAPFSHSISLAFIPEVHYNAMVPHQTHVIDPHGPRTPNAAQNRGRSLRRSSSSSSSSSSYKSARSSKSPTRSSTSFNTHLKTGYIQSLARLGENQGMLDWARQSPLNHVTQYYGNRRNKLIALKKNTHSRNNDGCKHAQHQAFVYKLHHQQVPLFIEQEIKRMCH